MTLNIRQASSADASMIAQLVRELAVALGETTQVTPMLVTGYLSLPGYGALLAEDEGRVAGALTYSYGPDLYHAAPCGVIRELVVSAGARRRGIGRRLVAAFLAQANTLGWAEVSVSTMADDRGAADFYRACGFEADAVQLACHFG